MKKREKILNQAKFFTHFPRNINLLETSHIKQKRANFLNILTFFVHFPENFNFSSTFIECFIS